MNRCVVLVPAHNEEEQIADTIRSLHAQKELPDHTISIVVISDNCSDQTEEIAGSMGVEVFRTVDNQYKKAGGLNQWLDTNLPKLAPVDLVMVMDADSTLDQSFLFNAYLQLQKGYGACGGVFTGKPGGGFIGMLQRNEYARYARDVKRKNGKTLVLTGTATLFTVKCLQDVVEGRLSGKIPGFDPQISLAPQVYDTQVLTEDNEATYALLHLGYKIIAPANCSLQTDIMTTWRELWNQRLRWKRGALENNGQYGFTKYTAKYWGLQVWGFIGVFVTVCYLITLTLGLATGSLHFYPLWIFVTVIYMIERAVTVKARGWRFSLLASVLVVEMSYDFMLQAVHIKALFDSIRKAKKDW